MLIEIGLSYYQHECAFEADSESKLAGHLKVLRSLISIVGEGRSQNLLGSSYCQLNTTNLWKGSA